MAILYELIGAQTERGPQREPRERQRDGDQERNDDDGKAAEHLAGDEVAAGHLAAQHEFERASLSFARDCIVGEQDRDEREQHLHDVKKIRRREQRKQADRLRLPIVRGHAAVRLDRIAPVQRFVEALGEHGEGTRLDHCHHTRLAGPRTGAVAQHRVVVHPHREVARHHHDRHPDQHRQCQRAHIELQAEQVVPDFVLGDDADHGGAGDRRHGRGSHRGH